MTNLEITLENLEKGNKLLIEYFNEFPERKKEFNMHLLGCRDGVEKGHQCKTSGCYLGNLAMVLPVVDDCFNRFNKFSYTLFLKHYFPYIDAEDNVWDFLFHETWSKYQPSAKKAIERGEYFIKKMKLDGKLGDWTYQKDSFTL